MGQEKIVLQKDILKVGLDLLRVWFDSAPGHQETPKPPSGGFLLLFCYALFNETLDELI